MNEEPRTRVSVEIVPRDPDSVRSDVAVIAEHLPGVDTINIPDLMKFGLRSWDACGVARQHRTGTGAPAYRAVPHIRAADLDPGSDLPMVAAIDAAGLEEVLVITGDAPIDFSRRTYDVAAVDAIARLRRDLPHLTVYAGLDPYRQSPVRELEYAERKLEAGAVGFFTQPFFDLSYMRAWASLVPAGVPVWWGATTVTSPGSLTYWRKRNLAVFPAGFQTTLEWHRSYAVGAVALARELGQHIYLMPVRASVHDYLTGIV